MITFILVVLAILLIGGTIIFGRLYVKTPANMAFVRTGLGGKKVVIDGGAIVWPVVQNIQWLSLETMKLEVYKANREAFITKDRFRVDIGAEFYLKIEPQVEAIEKASRSLGEKSFSPEEIKTLLEEKLISALRSEVAKRELVELHENRRDFARAVMNNLRDIITPNGLTLEDVSIFYLDQTAKDQLDPNNIFDAEGLRQITAQTSERLRERNEIERNTEVAIKKKDVEAVKLKLSLDQERSFAETEQLRQVEMDRAKKRAETDQFRFEQDRIAREAEIAKDRAIEQALRDKEMAIILKETERLREERKLLETEALKQEAAQLIITAQERVKAEREKELALIQALKELEIAEKRAKTAETLAKARRIEGETEAYVRGRLKESENVLDSKIIERDIVLELIGKLPEILRELMTPAKSIDSIRVLHVDGLTGGGEGVGGVDSVISSFLRAGAALPLLKELLEFAKIDTASLRQLIRQVPGSIKGVAQEQTPQG